MAKSFLFDIQRGCTHDGPGIRTVFFYKGCSLHCLWCHNPESHKRSPELLYYKNLCRHCGMCIAACSNRAILREKNELRIDPTHCVQCGKCAEACVNQALIQVGKAYPNEELLAIAEQDREFYDISGGGVTLSGGECLLQSSAIELLIVLKKANLHTVVETSGAVPAENLLAAIPFCDLFYFDIKTTDPAQHQHLCGASNELVLQNLQLLKQHCPEKIQLRMCIVPEIQDNAEEMHHLSRLARGIAPPELLPFHNWGKSKYHALHRPYSAENFPLTDANTLHSLQKILRKDS